MKDLKAWWTGVSLIAAFVLMGELTVAFGDYVYSRLGMNRDWILITLWLLPVVASFLVVYHSKEKGLLKGLSLILVLSVLGPAAHFLFGKFGATIDLAGLPGLKPTFQIFLVIGVVTCGIGSFAGMMFKRWRRPA